MALSMSSLLSGGLFAAPSSSPSVLTAPAKKNGHVNNNSILNTICYKHLLTGIIMW